MNLDTFVGVAGYAAAYVGAIAVGGSTWQAMVSRLLVLSGTLWLFHWMP